MGCCESSQEPRDINYIQRPRIPEYSQPTVRPVQKNKPYYGKFKCHSCKRHWDSRFCWPDKYQICKGCRSRVYPYTHRELDSNDFDGETNDSKEHQKELCQKCQESGQLCIKNQNLPKKKRYY